MVADPMQQRAGHWRERVKESTFGSFAQVKAINACDHVYAWRPAILFGYLRADEQCTLCKTWRVWQGQVFP